MKTLILTIIFILISSIAFAIPASSDTEPAKYTKCRGKIQVAYDVQEVNGTWTYNYVEIEGAVTEAKVLEALRIEALESDSGDWAPDEVAAEFEDSKAKIKLSGIADMTYAELDTYIEDNITNLAQAKTYLKKLSKVVLAILKQGNLE
jgi:hypothetical protein